MEPTYCYGDLVFVDGRSNPVNHHCWIEIGEEADPHRVVIDLTCDQADGLSELVLSAEYEGLLKQGLKYESKTRLKLDQLPSDRVWHRFIALSDAIDSIEPPRQAV